jgi:hypothetical protein
MSSGGLGNLPASSTLGQPLVEIQHTIAIAECTTTVRTNYEAFGQHVHVVIEAAAATQIWPSAATIVK